jgi:hypothetical protein
MSDTQLCSKTTKAGTACQGRALPGRDVCFSHARTPDDQRKAQLGQAAKRRAKRLAHDPRHIVGLRQEVTLQKAIDTAGKLLSGVPLSSPDSARTFHGQRELTHEGTMLGLLLLLQVTGPHQTPAQACAALLEAVPESMRPVYVTPPDDVYANARGQYRRAALRYSEAAGLFCDPYPPAMIAEWDTLEDVLVREPLPDLSDWEVEALGDSTTHVRALPPEGDPIIVRRVEVLASA